MLTDRQKLILKAIVEEYISTGEPVGSKILTEKPYLDFSSATIRFEMARLEELGYLEKTHTSSGRIPSDRGYKYYADSLVTRDTDVLEDFPLIDDIFKEKEFAREEAIKEALNLLSKLTNYTTVALGPDVKKCLIKRLDFIPISEREAVFLIVTDQGHVQNQTIKIPYGMDLEELRKIVSTLDDCLRNTPIEEAEELINKEFASIQIKDFIDYQEQIINTFVNAFAKFANENFYLSGVSNILNQREFTDAKKIKSFMDVLDRKSLIRVISDEKHSLSIKVGSENKIVPMEDCTVISVPYRVSEDQYGTVAVIGPTRMEYKKVIPLVEYIAKNMTKLYKK